VVVNFLLCFFLFFLFFRLFFSLFWRVNFILSDGTGGREGDGWDGTVWDGTVGSVLEGGIEEGQRREETFSRVHNLYTEDTCVAGGVFVLCVRCAVWLVVCGQRDRPTF